MAKTVMMQMQGPQLLRNFLSDDKARRCTIRYGTLWTAPPMARRNTPVGTPGAAMRGSATRSVPVGRNTAGVAGAEGRGGGSFACSGHGHGGGRPTAPWMSRPACGAEAGLFQSMGHKTNEARHVSLWRQEAQPCAPLRSPWAATTSACNMRRESAGFGRASGTRAGSRAPGGDRPPAPAPRRRATASRRGPMSRRKRARKPGTASCGRPQGDGCSPIRAPGRHRAGRETDRAPAALRSAPRGSRAGRPRMRRLRASRRRDSASPDGAVRFSSRL